MQKTLLILSLCIGMLCCYGCSKPSSGKEKPDTPEQPDKPDKPDKPDQPDPATPYFKAQTKDFYAFNCAGQGAEVYYETNISDWTATASEDWCYFIIEKERFVIMVKENQPVTENGSKSYDAPRSCTVTVKAGSVYSKTIQVLQECWTYIQTPFSYLADKSMVLSAAGGEADLSIRNNCYDWKVECNASWLSFTKKDASTLHIKSTARPASETSPRSAEVKIISALDDWINTYFYIKDSDATLSGEDYDYGDHTDWD